jgi:hypothetical protein
MAKTSGGVRGNRKNEPFLFSAGLRTSSGDLRVISKEFKNRQKGEDWIDKVMGKFGINNRTATIEFAITERGADVVGSRDISKWLNNQYKKQVGGDIFNF